MHTQTPFGAALDDYLHRNRKTESWFAREIKVRPSVVYRWRKKANAPRVGLAFARALRLMGRTVEDLYPERTPDTAPPASDATAGEAA